MMENKINQTVISNGPDVKWAKQAFDCIDDYGKMMRTALLLEDEIDKYIALHDVVDKETKKNQRLNFNTKVLLLRAFQIPKELCDVTQGINKIRNNFAHEKDFSFKKSKSDISNQIEKFDKYFTASPKSLYDYKVTLRVSEEEVIELGKVSEMELGDQLIAVTMAVATLISEEKKQSSSLQYSIARDVI